jgi:ankyrin repeat protein
MLDRAEIVRLVRERGRESPQIIELFESVDKNENILFWAAERSTEFLEVILDELQRYFEVNPKERGFAKEIDRKNATGFTALQVAVLANRLPSVRRLLKAGANPNLSCNRSLRSARALLMRLEKG